MVIKQNKVEKWDVFEVELKSSRNFDNPFTEVSLAANFTNGSVIKKAEGFYDGDSTWKIRFMPEEIGIYTFSTESSIPEFNGLEGSFESIQPSLDNHGPARVARKHHFSYADGTPLFVMGTTAYAWTYRPEEVRKQTLESFAKYGFNKIRMLVFPKYFHHKHEIDIGYEPPVLPFEGEFDGKEYTFDFKKYNVEYFRNFEERVKDLLKLGIEADVILFHGYDVEKWEIDRRISEDEGILYVKYLMARISSLRNVWWSLANEYDQIKDIKTGKMRCGIDRRDWDRIGRYIMENDPYNHLRSIHNWQHIYPDRDWITHASIQRINTYGLIMDLKKKYDKPVINDEYQYEGNLASRWGNLTGEVELFRHWLSAMAGGYATHGECYIVKGNRKDIFWTYGGTMVSQSAPRLKFLKEIMDSLPYQEMEQDYTQVDGINGFCLKKERSAYLTLMTRNQKGRPNRRAKIGEKLEGDTGTYEVTVYDLWNCNVLSKEVLGAGALVLEEYPAMLAVKAVLLQTK